MAFCALSTYWSLRCALCFVGFSFDQLVDLDRRILTDRGAHLRLDPIVATAIVVVWYALSVCIVIKKMT